MAGRAVSSRKATVLAQTPKVADAKTQRALDVHSQAILDLQSRRHLEQFTATEPGYVPESGGNVAYFLAADGVWKSIVGSGAVDSVTAGSSMVTASPTTGAVVVDVVPANFTGIPESGVTGLVADLAARPTGSGTIDTLPKWTSSTALGNSSVTDTGALVTVSNPLTVTGAGSFQSTVNVVGDFSVATNKFNVTAASGNTAIAGTLNTVGDLSVATNKFTVAAASGNTVVAGTLDVTSNLSVATNKFTVNASNGYSSFISSIAGGSVNGLKNTNATGYSATELYDSSGTFVGAFGYGNASATDASKQSKWYLRTQSHDFVVETGASGRQFALFGSTGNVNIGTTTSDPAVKLRVEGDTTVTGGKLTTGLNSGTAGAYAFNSYSAGNTTSVAALLKGQYYGVAIGSEQTSSSYYVFNVVSGMTAGGGAGWNTGGSSLFYVRADGFVGVGTTTQSDNSGFGGTTKADLELARTSSNAYFIATSQSATGGHSGGFYGLKNHGTRSVPAAVLSGEQLAAFGGSGYQTTNVNQFACGAQMLIQAAGDFSTTSIPARFVFQTVPSASTTLTERMRIDHNGQVGIGTSSMDANSTVHISASASGSIAGTTGSVLVIERSGAAFMTVKGSADKGVLFSNTTSSADGGVVYDNASLTRGMQLRTGGNTNRVTIDSSGNVAILTGTLDMSTHKILNVTNGSSAQDAAAFGQIATAVNAAVSGTTNTVPKFTSANVIGNSSITDDGTNVLTSLKVGLGGVTSPSGTLDVAINANATGGLVVQSWRNLFTGQNFAATLAVDSAKVVHLGTTSANTAWRFNDSSGTQVVRVDVKSGNTALVVTGNATFSDNVTLGDAVTDVQTVWGTTTFKQAVGTAVGGTAINVDLIDTTSMAAGVGGSLRFQGCYTGTTPISFAEVKAYKSDGTGGNFGGDLVFATRVNGGSLTEALRLKSDQSALFAGNVAINGDVAIGDAAGDKLTFHGGTGATQQTITGSRAGNAALADLLTKLATLGLIVDSTTA